MARSSDWFIRGKRPLKYVLSLLAMMLWVWMWWSGPLTIEHGLLQGFMVGSCLLVLILMWRMRALDEESSPLAWLHPARAVRYALWLGLEIVKANLDVAGRILSPRRPIRRRLIRASSSQKTDMGRTVFANSITLTPGTVSVIVDDDGVLVHALSDEAARGLLEGEMDRRVTVWEGRS